MMQVLPQSLVAAGLINARDLASLRHCLYGFSRVVRTTAAIYVPLPPNA
jgi:hypothetical protein